MSISDERLMAFADGELESAERAEIEAALAQDETLREKVAAHQQLRARLSAAFGGTLAEAVPDRLKAAAAPRAAEVVNFAERRAAKWSAREWSAMAASVAAGLLIGVGVMNTQAPLIAATDSGLVARGSLASALDTQLASDQAGAVRIGLSFRAQDGRYCRTFDLTRGETSGLACRDEDGWNVAMTARSAAGGEVRMAGATEVILAAVDEIIAGEPLDAAGETRARDAGWRDKI
ncbi:MAG: anti-sigma factor family protein [Caulobacteraceae bacterium]